MFFEYMRNVDATAVYFCAVAERHCTKYCLRFRRAALNQKMSLSLCVAAANPDGSWSLRGAKTSRFINNFVMHSVHFQSIRESVHFDKSKKAEAGRSRRRQAEAGRGRQRQAEAGRGRRRQAETCRKCRSRGGARLDQPLLAHACFLECGSSCLPFRHALLQMKER